MSLFNRQKRRQERERREEFLRIQDEWQLSMKAYYAAIRAYLDACDHSSPEAPELLTYANEMYNLYMVASFFYNLERLRLFQGKEQAV